MDKRRKRRKKKQPRQFRTVRGFIRVFVTLAAVVLIMMIWNVWDNRSFEETLYSVSTEKFTSKVRAIMLSDLHQKEFGERNKNLIERIDKLKPDVILIDGDMVNKNNPNSAVIISLCQELTNIAPVYYSLGNHENELVFGQDMIRTVLDQTHDEAKELDQFIRDDSLIKAIEETGATVLLNSQASLEIRGNHLDIGGINTNLSSMWPYSGDFITDFSDKESEHYKLLMSHRPEPVANYLYDMPIDLCVSGHTHGGAIRIPGLGGLYANEQGILPEMDAGIYELNKTKLLIGRGLGGVPRVFNRPELVVIDINGE